MPSKGHKEKQEHTKHRFWLTLRCICWLKQKLVLQHVNRLNVVRTLPFSVVTQSGAETAKNHVTSQNAPTQCASSGGYYQAPSVGKPSREKRWKETSTTTSIRMTHPPLNSRAKPYANLETKSTTKNNLKNRYCLCRRTSINSYFDWTRLTTGGLTFFKMR